MERYLTPKTEITRRIQGLQTLLDTRELDGALILQKADLFYYTGTTQNGWLYVPVTGVPLFMVFKDLDRARLESGMGPDTLIPLMSPKQIPRTLEERGLPLPKTLGMELDVLPANLYFMYQKLFAPAQIADLSPDIRLQRAVKSEFEISCIRSAASRADQVAAQVPELIREGMPEIELAGLLEAHARKLGHQGLIFMRMWENRLFYGHLLCGDHGAVPGALASPTSGTGMSPLVGQGASDLPIGPHQPVLVDYVFAKEGYLADHTRIFTLGPLEETLHQAHRDMLEIQTRVVETTGPGSVSGDIYELMVEMARNMGHGDYFMGGAEPRIRFTGHGIGIELDEFPFLAKGQTLELEPGMVIALEPKLVIPGRGTVGIENTFLVTPNGLEKLTNYPDEICIL